MFMLRDRQIFESTPYMLQMQLLSYKEVTG